MKLKPFSGMTLPSCALALLTFLVFVLGCGCATTPQTAGLAVAGATVLGAQAPSHEIEQIYYLGVFDPHEQLPPAIYRITVRGQASFLSGTKFASGWVPAGVIDSLAGKVRASPYDQNELTISADTNNSPTFNLDRRLVMFGPEGFREAPRDHRLVVVMGASPKAWFEALDQALADLSPVNIERANSAMQKELLNEVDSLASRREPIARLETRILEEIK